MAVTFLLQIRGMRKDSSLITPKLVIISNYGLAACCFVFITLGCVAACLICLLVNLHAQNEQAPNIYRVFWMIKDVSIQLIGVMIVAMRIALMFAENQQDSSHIDDRIRESLAAQGPETKGSDTRESVATEGGMNRIRKGSSVSPYIPRTLDRRGSSVRVSIVASTNEIIA
ncbi:hypothetical protein BCR33DRAFT_719269 [Rhizoclosmatium globosum]|uniref:Uncharacterized protein n=1 Tax=Rhizoclosmatium globosum TaxID=329046 RepID=A0A1Y2C125_9FUNG|nr:hypothetical protein BCR33DRAFT_719269 [Rhizoclosmatium globosum]|eukprot:ORY40728.1 hypothetical protein BCR33DRAFT_719269 [Rhizoclosmatium globosum]